MSHYPCPALPVHQLTLRMVYCQTHAGWAVEVERLAQVAGDEAESVSRTVFDMGPFWTLEEIERAALDAFRTALRSPGSPWD